MINNKNNPVEWALLIYELDELREHVESLVDQMSNDGHISNEEYETHIGHLYAHLNRSWNSRNSIDEDVSEKFNEFTKFPTDIETCG
jgi:polyhydroxyalkanoate synthesis regulator phasin